MTRDIMIGADLAKNVFQLHAAGMTGAVLYRTKLSREKFRSFMAQQVPAVVMMEACGSVHYWARELTQLGGGPLRSLQQEDSSYAPQLAII